MTLGRWITFVADPCGFDQVTLDFAIYPLTPSSVEAAALTIVNLRMTRRYLTAEEERPLIRLAQAGDMVARDRVIDNIMPLLWRDANKIAAKHPPADPADLVQEGVLKIVKSFHKFDLAQNTRFSTYFLRAARNAMCNAALQNGVVRCIGGGVRHNLKEKTLALQQQHSGPLASLDAPSPDDDCMLSDLIQDHCCQPDEEARRQVLAKAVRACIQRMPFRYRRLVEWRFLEGRTLKEIAGLYFPNGDRHLTRQRIWQILVEAMRWVKQILLSNELVREFVTEHGDPLTALSDEPRLKTRVKQAV